MSKVKITNRGIGTVIYTVQMDNGQTLRRQFSSGETREVESEEIERLSWTPGGRAMLMNYFLIKEPAVVNQISENVEPEYYMTEEDIRTFLNSSSMDEFLDCLDNAPIGVLDLIKKLSVELPLNDSSKREAIRKTLGFDVSKAILIKEEANRSENSEPAEEQQKPASGRRVKKEEKKPSGRRAALPVYNVVKTSNE